jgi:hypothetical protein
MNIYLEIGRKKTFASALDWPGLARPGRDQTTALQSLFDYAPRYQQILQSTNLNFQPPADPTTFHIVERLTGNAATDFGVLDMHPSTDANPIDDSDLKRFQTLLEAYWQAFDTAVEKATGHELRKGPRGGGRELEGIVEHTLDADSSYLASLGWKFKKPKDANLTEQLRQLRQAILEGLAASARGEIDPKGPRGGLRWPPRYYVRRSAWHLLDHLWEIEDRVMAET